MKTAFSLIAIVLSLTCALWADEPALRVTPPSLGFVAATGKKDVPQQQLSLWLGDRARRWKIEKEIGADWLSITPTEGNGSVARMTAHCAIRHTGLKPGEYGTKITVTLIGSPEAKVEVPVRLNIFALKNVWDVGGRKQLFIDHRFIESSENIQLGVNPPIKLGQIQDETGKPWPGHYDLCWRVLEENGKFHLYMGVERMVVAESQDGIHWKECGRIPVGGTILCDPRDVAERRYKLVTSRGCPPDFKPASDGIYMYTSADGLNFSQASRVLPMWLDNPLIPNWDDRIGRYVIFTRAHEQPKTAWEKTHGVENQRRVSRIETDDLLAPWPYDKTWPLTYNQSLMTTKQFPPVIQADDQDYRWSDFYYNCGTIYPEAQDVYLMFLANFAHFRPEYHTWIKQLGKGWEDFGLLETQLAVSRDGIHWERPERIPYIPMGRADEWDRWLNNACPGFARKGNDLFQYYSSSAHTHDGNMIRPEEYAKQYSGNGGVGVVKQRLDGFVSADTDQRGGSIETPPMVFSGNKLRLNIDTGAMGWAKVEIRNAQSQPIKGFELNNCDEIEGNYVDYYVNWNSSCDVSNLIGKPIRLYFEMKRAKLYGFQFTNE